MSFIKDILTGSVEKMVTAVGDTADKLFTSDEERLKLKNELETIKLNAALEASKVEKELEIKVEEEVSKRWSADMQSDEPLAKKVRPVSLVYLMLIVTVMAFADGNLATFNVKDSYIDLFQALLMLVFGAYFGSRGLEKIARIRGK